MKIIVFRTLLLALIYTGLLGSTAYVYGVREDLSQVWPARWITTNGPQKEYGVHYFRRNFEIDKVPEQLLVHTSGDTIYQLFVNGKKVSYGPQTGDLRHWYYETTDIAPYLVKGDNVIAAKVLNYGSHPPDARLTVQTAFLLCADDSEHRFLNTGNGEWKTYTNETYKPNIVDSSQVRGYYGGGSREIVDGRLYPWGWQARQYDDSHWQKGLRVETAFARGCKWASRWKLTPRVLPHQRLTPGEFEAIRLVENAEVTGDFVKNQGEIRIEPNTTARIIFDWDHVTTAYPVLKTGGGKDSVIKATYVEAPHIGDIRDRNKGHRDVIEGKTFLGFFDQFTLDGAEQREYTPLWWRAFRFIELSIQTQDEPLVIHSYDGIHSSYPYEKIAQFQLLEDNQDFRGGFLNEMIEIGHRTIFACAHEGINDCPYYEESQFPGDARIQALISYSNYGDPLLGKNAVDQFSWSINNEGFISARYPTNSLYYIPNYSLYWIGMLYDYWMHIGDDAFIRSKLPVSRMILSYYKSKERMDGTLNKLDYHRFVDWSFPQGEEPIDEAGYSALADLHYLMALQWAYQLEEGVGENSSILGQYQQSIDKLKSSIQERYWNGEISLYTDVPSNPGILSQHTNTLAILTGIIEGEAAKDLMHKILTQDAMTQATLYWSFYIFEALHKSGLGGQYFEHLDIWEKLMDLGVKTWPESGANSRSECHGWGANPNYHLYKLIAGIEPAESGFKKVKIQPQIKSGQELDIKYPHPMGEINIRLKYEHDHLSGSVTLPEKITGKFIWRGVSIDLEGTVTINI